MSTNLKTSGDVIAWTNGTGSAVVSGQPVHVGNYSPGVATVDIANSATGSVAIKGAYSFPKNTSDAIAQGGKGWWDASAGEVVNEEVTDSGDFFLGFAILAAGASATSVTLALTPAWGDIGNLTETEVGFLGGVTAGTAAASKALVLDANKDIATIRHITTNGNIVTGTTTLSEADLAKIDAITNGTVASAKAVVPDTAKQIDTLAIATPVLGVSATAGAATSARRGIIKKTGIADNTATSVLTVTVPNANHSAVVKLTLLSSNGSTDAFESSRTAQGAVVLARTTGVDTVATAATLALTAIATVGSGATHTLAYGVTSMTGASSASQTFDIQLTINDSGDTGSNQAVIEYELINAEATGVTVAAA